MKLKFGIYLSAHTHPVCDVCVRALWPVGVNALTEGVSEAWCWRNFSSANGGVSQLDRLMQIPNPVHATPEKYVSGCCNYDGASAPRFRHALRQALTPTPRVNAAWARARAHTRYTHTHTHTHTRHTPDVCVHSDHLDMVVHLEFSHTNRSFRVLGHQMCSYDGELFNLDFSVHVLFPSYRDSDL